MANNDRLSVPWRPASRRMSMDDERQPGYWDSFEVTKFNVNNYFAFYRRGLSSAIGQPWKFDEVARNPANQLYRHHLEFRRIRGPWENVYRDIPPERNGGRQRFRPLSSGSQRDGTALDKARMLQQAIDANGFPFRVVKTLGAGGNGVAVLCDTADVGQGGGVRKRFVVKLVLDGAAPMGAEKQHMMNLKRAAHITQMLRTREMAPMLSSSEAENLDADDSIQTLEFCKHGDLMSLLERIDDKEPMPAKHVLKIFACLIRACIAMQYPPRRQRASNGGLLDAEEVGPTILETVPPRENRNDCAYDLVHFDLDTQNILLGDLDEAEHRTMPVCKVADFGLSGRTTSTLFTEPIRSLNYRLVGKSDHPLPEQFHKEWEFVDILPQTQAPPPKVAGQYGPASNVFAIGLCMHSVITRASPPEPLRPFGPLNNNDPAVFDQLQLPEAYRVIRDVHKRQVAPFYTYGATLLEEEFDIGIDIICLLIRCMADQPAHRPSLEELEIWVKLFEEVEGLNDPDDYYEQVYGRPPDPSKDILSLFPNFQLLPRAGARSNRNRLNSEPIQRADITSRATTWMGPPRAESALARVDLGIVPARGRPIRDGGRDDGRDANRDEYDSSASLDLTRSRSRDGSNSSMEDWLGPRREDERPDDTVLSSGRQATNQEDDIYGAGESSSNRQPESQGDNSAGNGGSSSRRSDSGQNSRKGSQVQQQGSEPDRSREKAQEGENNEQAQAGQSADDLDMQDLIARAPDVAPSPNRPSTSSVDPGCNDLQSEIDMRRINVSPDGIGMSSDEDEDHANDDDNNDDDGDGDDQDNPGARPLANTPNNHNPRQPSSASAIARGEAARQALRAARRSRPGPSRLARVLTRLRIRPLPSAARAPSPPAREPRPDQAQRAARSSRFTLSRFFRPRARPPPAPVDRQTRRRPCPSPPPPQQQPPAAARGAVVGDNIQPGLLQRVNVLTLQPPPPASVMANQPQGRLRHVGCLPERGRQTARLNSQQPRNRISRPGPLPAGRTRPPPIAGQPHINRSRRAGRLPEWRSPPLGSLQGIPYPNAIPGQPQSIPVVPASDNDNATRLPNYINVEGVNLLNPAEAPVASGGNMISSDVLPIGDPRHMARAYAGEAVMDTSLPRGQPDTIWHTPSLDMRPIPGYFRTHLVSLLGVQRIVYFYRVGSDGADAVLATRLRNPGQGDMAARRR